MASNDCLDWVGGSYTLSRFLREAEWRGCCRKVAGWPPWLKPGKSRVFLAHRGTFDRPDRGIVFGYYMVAGVDVVMSDWKWARYRKLLGEYRAAPAHEREGRPLIQFWLDEFGYGLPLAIQGEESEGKKTSRRKPPDEPKSEGEKDELAEVLIDFLLDCEDDIEIPNAEPSVVEGIPTFQTSLEEERECGFRPRESEESGERRRSALYLVDRLTREVDRNFCELLKKLIVEALADEERPPRERRQVLERLHQQLEQQAVQRTRGRRLRRGAPQFEQACRNGAKEPAATAEIPAELGDLAEAHGSLVLFREPYPHYRLLPSASFRGILRVDGDTLLARIRAHYEGTGKVPIELPYVHDELSGDRPTQAHLVAELASACQCKKEMASDLLRSFVGILGSKLQQGKRLTLPGLGTFTVRSRAARKGTHPTTRKEIDIPERTYVAFRPAIDLLRRLRG